MSNVKECVSLISSYILCYMSRDMTKPTMWVCDQRRLRSAWASAQSDQSSLSAWRNIGALAKHWAHSGDSDKTGRMPRLMWVFAGCTLILLVLWRRGSYYYIQHTVPFKQILLLLNCVAVVLIMSFIRLLWKASQVRMSPDRSMFIAPSYYYAIIDFKYVVKMIYQPKKVILPGYWG